MQQQQCSTRKTSLGEIRSHLPVRAAANFVDQHGSFLARRMSHTFLNHIAANTRVAQINTLLIPFAMNGALLSEFYRFLLKFVILHVPCKFMLAKNEYVPS